MRTINREIVSALIFSKNGKLLLGMKDPDKGGVYNDCWHLPGGGVDANETNEQALIREIKEEFGLEISSYKITLVDDMGRGESEKVLKDTNEKVLCLMKFYVYRVEISDLIAEEIEISTGDDFVQTKWFEISELNAIKLTPPSQVLFKKLRII